MDTENAPVDFTAESPSEYEDQTFDGLVVGGQEIHKKTFAGCTFTRCALPETTFKSSRFRDCTFTDCDLSLIHVPGSSFRDVKFEQSKLLGINWSEAAWAKEGLLNSIDFFDCVINYSTFVGLGLKGIHITRCVAKGVNFAETDLTEADCTRTDFSESRFLNTNLTEADFTGATHYAINATTNTLSKTKFSLPEAMSLLYSLDIVLADE
jgi:fluoroquinolone resistance protein